ncbi:MAG: hypothetical protein A2Z20_03740 [Bdellovibrionales bacterium RBG_16_40_8]|nr:MAG: hypothetical protein A2Z20_03740 [Bdellovibrionales bacterium RBG_16_40_8]
MNAIKYFIIIIFSLGLISQNAWAKNDETFNNDFGDVNEAATAQPSEVDADIADATKENAEPAPVQGLEPIDEQVAPPAPIVKKKTGVTKKATAKNKLVKKKKSKNKKKKPVS